MNKIIILNLLILLLFTGCIKDVNDKGVVVEISEHQIYNSLKDSFPYERDFMFGVLKLDSPVIKMHKKRIE